jgi:hypothetical protein
MDLARNGDRLLDHRHSGSRQLPDRYLICTSMPTWFGKDRARLTVEFNPQTRTIFHGGRPDTSRLAA